MLISSSQKSNQQQLKTKPRRTKFATIGCPLQPVVTRWGSCLNPALLHAKNLPEVKIMVESVEGSGILVTQANVSLQTTDLAS